MNLNYPRFTKEVRVQAKNMDFSSWVMQCQTTSKERWFFFHLLKCHRAKMPPQPSPRIAAATRPYKPKSLFRRYMKGLLNIPASEVPKCGVQVHQCGHSGPVPSELLHCHIAMGPQAPINAFGCAKVTLGMGTIVQRCLPLAISFRGVSSDFCRTPCDG